MAWRAIGRRSVTAVPGSCPTPGVTRTSHRAVCHLVPATRLAVNDGGVGLTALDPLTNLMVPVGPAQSISATMVSIRGFDPAFPSRVTLTTALFCNRTP